MIHLIYVSSATRDMTEEDLIFLLEQSRDRNLRQNVTGMLLFIEGNFIQVLEGEQNDVEEIYAAIVNDERNSGNIVLIKNEISERDFSDWRMGFKHLSPKNKSEIEGFTEFLDKDMTTSKIARSSNDAVKLLYHFKKNIEFRGPD